MTNRYKEYLNELSLNIPYAHFKPMEQWLMNQKGPSFREGYTDRLGELTWNHQCQGVDFKL